MKTIRICNPLRVALNHSALAVAVAAGLATAPQAQAAPTVWTGPAITFSKAANADWTLPENQDRITDHVWITRGNNKQIFNIVLETAAGGFDSDSPQDTEWAWPGKDGNPSDPAQFKAGNYAALNFGHFDHIYNIPDVVTMPAVVHLITDDIYLEVQFTSWSSGDSGGGFSYTRSTAPVLWVKLDTPADTQGYPTGTSITASATVVEPGAFTDTVTFHTTPVNPPGPTVDTVSTDTSSPFSAVLGALVDGTYEIYATVANNDDPPDTYTSATRTFTVAAAIPTTTALTTTANPSTYGQCTATATVSPPPTGGTVQFYDGGIPLGSPVAVNTGTGEASFSLNTLGVGTHGITANYSGHWLHATSATSTSISQVVDKAELTVKALNVLRAPNTPNPVPFPYQITGYQNGEVLLTSGVTGTPALTTLALIDSPPDNYTITCAVGELLATNYSFAFVDGILTVAEVADTFSVSFYAYGGLTTDEQKANVLVPAGVPAGLGDWYTSGWQNIEAPWGGGLQPAVTLTSNKGSSTATFTFKDCRNGWTYNGPRTTLLGDGNGNMMDGHVNSTLQNDGNPNLFDMEVTDIPFAVYDVIFYMGANLAQFGDGTGVIKFNGGADRAFTLKPGAFDGTFTEMVDATTQGNYIVFPGVTGSSFTTQTWGTGAAFWGPELGDFNHLGPFGFQIREVTVAAGYSTWASTNADNQSPGEDYDNDGVQNGIEYFMGQTGSSFTAMPGLDGTNTVTWTKDPAYSGTWQVQTSPDLSTWTDVAGTDNGTSVSYTLLTGADKLFVRLLVTPTP